MAKGETSSLRMVGRVSAVAVTAAVGTIAAVGFGIAALFERDGFGRPRDSEPRVWYLALLALGFAVAVAVPIAAATWRTRARPLLVAAGVVGVIAGLALFGLSV